MTKDKETDGQTEKKIKEKKTEEKKCKNIMTKRKIQTYKKKR